MSLILQIAFLLCKGRKKYFNSIQFIVKKSRICAIYLFDNFFLGKFAFET